MNEFEGLLPPDPQAAPVSNGELPPDIQAVWGNTSKDRTLAAYLIQAWGLDVFRGSALHQVALTEHDRKPDPKATPKPKR